MTEKAMGNVFKTRQFKLILLLILSFVAIFALGWWLGGWRESWVLRSALERIPDLNPCY